MRLTNAGLKLLTNVQGGADNLIFTKAVLGDGEMPESISALTAPISPKIECAINSGKRVGDNTYQIGAFFSNTSITTGFLWKELAIYAKGKDEKEVLYCYANSGDACDYIPVGSDQRIEKYIYISLAIGNAENVTAEINSNDTFIPMSEKGKAGGVAPLNGDGKIDGDYLPEMDYATNQTFNVLVSDYEKHKSASNPHNITAATVGLDKVPNVATNDQTPTYTEKSNYDEVETIKSGEKLGVVLSKIKRAIDGFITHFSEMTCHVGTDDRNNWNSKAPKEHSSMTTEHGLGSENYYGHVKVLENASEMDLGAVHSSAVTKEIHDKAVKGGYKLLKTQNISITTIDKFVKITGVNLDNYSEILLRFEGNVIFKDLRNPTTTTSSIGATTYLQFYYQSNASYGRAMAKVNFEPIKGTTNTTTMNFETELLSLNYIYKNVAADGTIIETNEYKKVGVFTSGGTGLTKATYLWDSKNIYFTTESPQTTECSTTIEGVVKVYGKEVIS